MRSLAACAIILGALSTAAHAGKCNTSAGYIADQPAAPDLVADSDAVVDAAAAPEALADISPAASDASPRNLDDQTLKLELSKDLAALRGLKGRYTEDAPVLGLRLENVPGFNPRRHCNIIQPILYKPKITRLADGRISASVDKGRFHIEFGTADMRKPWTRDPDPSNRFYWIFPASFGKALPVMAASYDAAFRRQPSRSVRRRWVAEAYLDIVMRYYWLRAVDAGFPTGSLPSRADLTAAVRAAAGTTCDASSTDLVCLASRVIEANEVAPPGDQISRKAFIVIDALYENSGVSAGIRQLDFGTRNDQATKVVKSLFPSTLGRYANGYGYRRPIRQWDIDAMSSWVDADGRRANEELSRDEAKQLLIDSHAEFLASSARAWASRIDAKYPLWLAAERQALAVMAIDLENVTGHALRLPAEAAGVCDVLGDQTLPADRRSNARIADDQRRRLTNAKRVLGTVPGMTATDWTCIQ
jgi:hypothetical protein